GPGCEYPSEPIGFADRQRFEHEHVGHREDQRVRANCQADRDACRQGKCWLLDEQPRTVTHVFENHGDHCISQSLLEAMSNGSPRPRWSEPQRKTDRTPPVHDAGKHGIRPVFGRKDLLEIANDRLPQTWVDQPFNDDRRKLWRAHCLPRASLRPSVMRASAASVAFSKRRPAGVAW